MQVMLPEGGELRMRLNAQTGGVKMFIPWEEEMVDYPSTILAISDWRDHQGK